MEGCSTTQVSARCGICSDVRVDLYSSLFGRTLEELLGIEDRHAATKLHSRRAHRYALVLARAVDPAVLDDASVEYGFAFHDIGKIGIPDTILLKPAALTKAERKLMETHTELGEKLLGKLALFRGEGLTVVRSHHERWDGGGYPDGLTGTAIALSVRIFAVADSLDAMTSHRPYRRARSWSDAAAEIRRGAGGQFDPDVVDVFNECEPVLRQVHGHLAAV